MKNSKILLLIVLISGSFLSCKKERLTKATQNGGNTFWCKVDGKVFVAKDVIAVPITPGILATFDRNTKKFGLYTTEPKDKSENDLNRNVNIEIFNPKEGQNMLNNSNVGEIVVSQKYQSDTYFITNDNIGGSVTISRLDTLTHIISGYFGFQATARNNVGSVINITDGRFDITYK